LFWAAWVLQYLFEAFWAAWVLQYLFEAFPKFLLHLQKSWVNH
jgi:hypothetical protein